MTCKELQEEELEVLHSIYEGDDSYKELNPTTFQYKYGEEGSYKAYNIEITWGDNYPEEPPGINVNTFYNKHILDDVKRKIVEELKQQIDDLLGTAMTYTLFEWAKENAELLLADQPDAPPVFQVESKPEALSQEQVKKKEKEKKEQLSKSQKRKMYNRLTDKGELPRGWNWVDIVKHLSQTGHSHRKETENS